MGAYMNKLIKAFWNCGDSNTIKYAVEVAHLNRIENEVLHLILDECRTQEQVAEILDFSTRAVQDYWSNGIAKILRIPWVMAYAQSLIK